MSVDDAESFRAVGIAATASDDIAADVCAVHASVINRAISQSFTSALIPLTTTQPVSTRTPQEARSCIDGLTLNSAVSNHASTMH